MKNDEVENKKEQCVITEPNKGLLTHDRIQWLDILKGIGILMVIGGHSLITNSYLATMIWSVHMPLFFICAGITFKFYPRKIAFEKNVKRLMIPYVVGCLVVLLFDLILSRMILHNGSYDLHTVWIVIEDYMGRMIYGSGMHGFTSDNLHINLKSIGALWFFCALFVSRIVYNEIAYFPKKWKTVLVLMLFVFGYQSTNFLTEAKGIWLPFSIQTGITALIFLYMGELIRDNMSEIEKHKRSVLLCSSCIYVFVIYCGISAGMVGNTYGRGYLGILGAFFGTVVWMFVAKGIAVFPVVSQVLGWIGTRTDRFLIFHLAELNFVPWKGILSVFIENFENWDEYICSIYIYICKVMYIAVVVGVIDFAERKIKKIFATSKLK